ncbi:DUF3833 family protein [Anianabacter salinae]|uniref:DUF3833 family protein n=1 Tax=Anianabacter salinae TaxID=2851023 RepID=UPI00225E3545|nr:DUF3833 family protein [Anianabacter salinae]MBV0913331.1 DUF3833 domain-containing protein [Anianabacter salinae]
MEGLIYLLTGVALTLLAVWLRSRFLTFRAQRPEEMRNLAPGFDLRKHLNGAFLCEGVIFGPTGRVASRFVADMDVTWDGNVGTMVEEFRYDSGATQHRNWTIEVAEDGSLKATAPDVVGTGTGQQMGPGVRLKYRLKLPKDAGGHELDAVDWMYLVEGGTIVNRSQFRKYGITVVELVATMRPKEVS